MNNKIIKKFLPKSIDAHMINDNELRVFVQLTATTDLNQINNELRLFAKKLNLKEIGSGIYLQAGIADWSFVLKKSPRK